jgi:hypothetical protein
MMKSEVITIRIDSEILEAIRSEARESFRSIAQQINYTLKQHQERGKKDEVQND